MSVRTATSLLTAILLALAPPALADDSPTPGELEFFEKKVRPVFAFNCVHCHGPNKQESHLRLDHIAFIKQGGDRGPAIIPGKPKDSLLIDAVHYGTLNMPPTGKLPDEAVAILTRWIAEGAVWPDEPKPAGTAPKDRFDLQARMKHWSFQPLSPISPPKVANRGWPRVPLDNFILARLEEARLKPAPPADKRTLIRRVYFDLVGLPPSPRAVERFLADDAPDAYARLVGTLLASPHFGERWGRHWLDLVRFAETYGHEFDWRIPHAWRYRDYVIRAINANVPYDDFVREHIAGDLLTHPRRDPTTGINQSIIATGFWHLHSDKHAPVDVRRAEAIRYENQIDVFGKAFLGLTIACARCHDHKFDPITAADYYALAGFLRSSRRQMAALDPHGTISDITRQITQLRTAATEARITGLATAGEEVAGDLRALLNKRHSVAEGAPVTDRLSRWNTLLAQPDVNHIDHPLFPLARSATNSTHTNPKRMRGNTATTNPKRKQGNTATNPKRKRENTATFVSARQDIQDAQEQYQAFLNRTKLFEDFSDTSDWITAGWAFDQTTMTGHVPAGPPEADDSIDSRRLALPLVGSLRSDDFTITHDTIWIRCAGKDARIRLVVDGYQMDVFSALLFKTLTQTINTNGDWKWINIQGDLGDYIGHRGYFELLDEGDGWLAVDEIRFADSPTSPPPDPSAVALSLIDKHHISSSDLVNTDTRLFQNGQSQLIALLTSENLLPPNKYLEHAKQLTRTADNLAATLPEPIRVLAMQEGFGCNEELFIRGSHKQTKGPVPRRFLVALAGKNQPIIEHGSGRLQLANRLLARENPLPARVKVNRVWHHLFGRGIVPSVDNLGVLGQDPTHPELLDYLANDFRDDGWSVKRLIRRIVLSETYRMSSRPHPATRSRAKRIDPANALLYAQRLRRLEGEAIRDAILAVSGQLNEMIGGDSIPVHLTAFSDGRGRPKVSGPLDGDGRRSVYIRVQRNFLTPLLTAFDFPLPSSTIGRRNVSNVPAQALILLNDPFVMQQSKKWAARVFQNRKQHPKDRVESLYITAYGRPPTPKETTLALKYLQSIGGQNWTTNQETWADYCHVLINTKEFIFIR